MSQRDQNLHGSDIFGAFRVVIDTEYVKSQLLRAREELRREIAPRLHLDQCRRFSRQIAPQRLNQANIACLHAHNLAVCCDNQRSKAIEFN